MVGLQCLVFRTRFGRAMRAVSFDHRVAALMGIPVDRVIAVTFMLGSALAAGAGILYAIKDTAIEPLMGLYVGLKAFVAAVIGGIGNVPGAVVGALAAGPGGGVRRRLHREQLARRGGLRLPDHRAARPAGRAVRPGRGGEGVMAHGRRAVRVLPGSRRRCAASLPVLVAAAPVLLEWSLLERPAVRRVPASIVGVNIILAVSLNIVNGMTGQFSIGHAGFMAVGAYIAGIARLALKDVAISGLPGAVLGPGVLRRRAAGGRPGRGGSAASSWACPSLRLRGDYLAIVTLGFGEIIRVVVQNTEALRARAGPVRHPAALEPVHGLASGSSSWCWWRGASPAPAHGRSLWAIREDEVAAEAMGVDTTGYKVRAFVISSFFAGVAGGLFAHFVPIINPGSFTFVKSMEVVVMVVLGGLGSTTGAIVAAVFLTLLPEALRSLFIHARRPETQSLAQKVDQIRMPDLRHAAGGPDAARGRRACSGRRRSGTCCRAGFRRRRKGM